MRGELHRAVGGGGRGWRRRHRRRFRRGSWRRRWFGKRNRGIGGRVLSSGRATGLALRAASGTGMSRHVGRNPALSSLRAAPATPTRRHPPEMRTTPLSARSRHRLRRWSHRHSRQPDIRRHGRWIGRPQQARRRLQQEHPRHRHKGNAPSSRPANPETIHTELSAQRGSFVPMRTLVWGNGHPCERLVLFPSSGLRTVNSCLRKKLSEDGCPFPPLNQPPDAAPRCPATGRRPSLPGS